jgi:hypothetical protein
MVDENFYTHSKKRSAFMPTPAGRSATNTRAPSKETVDLSAFAVTVRKLSREMHQVYRVVRTPLSSDKDARLLVRTIDELERSAILLRGRVAPSVSESGRAATGRTAHKAATKVAAHVARTGPSLIFDTMETMLAQGQMLDAVQFQERMGWKTRQAVWKAASDQRTFYLEFRAERYFPAFYADPAYQRSHLEAVTKILGDLPGGSKLQFFLTRKGSLNGNTPLEALAAGDLSKVKSVAMAFAELPMKV